MTRAWHWQKYVYQTAVYLFLSVRLAWFVVVSNVDIKAAIHCTILHCTALHCTALHYITQATQYRWGCMLMCENKKYIFT
jgi:hypothetical protein